MAFVRALSFGVEESGLRQRSGRFAPMFDVRAEARTCLSGRFNRNFRRFFGMESAGILPPPFVQGQDDGRGL